MAEAYPDAPGAHGRDRSEPESRAPPADGRPDRLRRGRQDHGRPRARARRRSPDPLPLHGRQRRVEQPAAAHDAACQRGQARPRRWCIARARRRRRTRVPSRAGAAAAPRDPGRAAPGQPPGRGVVPPAPRRGVPRTRRDRRLRPALPRRLPRLRRRGQRPAARAPHPRLGAESRLSAARPRRLPRRAARRPACAQGRRDARLARPPTRRLPRARRQRAGRRLRRRFGDAAAAARGRGGRGPHPRPGGGRMSPVAPRVLVTDASRGSAIAFIRSLGRRGVEVVAGDHHPRSAGFRSRYVSQRLVYPDPAEAPEAAIDELLGEAARRKVDLVVPVSDEVLLPLSAARARFRGVCALAVPEPDALAVVTDKRATLALGRRLGVPAPRTALAHDVDEALAVAPELGWPVVVKPLASRVYRDGTVTAHRVAYANGPEALAREIGRLAGRCPALLQEYYAGEGHGVELLTDRGRPIAAFQHRRLHEVPFTGGASALREGVALDPELYGHAVRLLAELRWTGLAMVEFRVGPEGPLLMEINGRIWGSLPLAVKSGVDFPMRLVELHLGRRLDAAAGARGAEGVRSRNVGLELVWIASVLRRERRYPFLPAPRRRDAVAAALRLPWPRDGFDVLCRDDPLPAFAELAAVTGHLARKARHAA